MAVFGRGCLGVYGTRLVLVWNGWWVGAVRLGDEELKALEGMVRRTEGGLAQVGLPTMVPRSHTS